MINFAQHKLPLIQRTKTALIAWSLLILLATIWGSSFILMKKAMFSESGAELITSSHVAALRILFASATMIPFVLRGFWSNLRAHWRPLLITGWLGNGLPAFLFTAAQTELDSSITGILNSLTPLFTLIVALILYKRRYPFVNYIGIVVALIGAVLLIFGHSSGLAGAPLRSYAWVTLATVCYAISVNVIKNDLAGLSAIKVTGLAMVWVSPWCLVYLWIDGFFNSNWESSAIQQGIPFVVLLGVIGTAAALVVFNHVIKISSALFASSVTYLIPIVAVFWGFVDDEIISLSDLIFAATIISGVYMVNLKPQRTKRLNI